MRRFFRGYGWFNGTLTSWNPRRGLFSITYDDGDCGELDEEEVNRAISAALAHAAGKQDADLFGDVQTGGRADTCSGRARAALSPTPHEDGSNRVSSQLEDERPDSGETSPAEHALDADQPAFNEQSVVGEELLNWNEIEAAADFVARDVEPQTQETGPVHGRQPAAPEDVAMGWSLENLPEPSSARPAQNFAKDGSAALTSHEHSTVFHAPHDVPFPSPLLDSDKAPEWARHGKQSDVPVESTKVRSVARRRVPPFLRRKAESVAHALRKDSDGAEADVNHELVGKDSAAKMGRAWSAEEPAQAGVGNANEVGARTGDQIAEGHGCDHSSSVGNASGRRGIRPQKVSEHGAVALPLTNGGNEQSSVVKAVDSALKEKRLCNMSTLLEARLLCPGTKVLKVERMDRVLYGDLLSDGNLRYNAENTPQENVSFRSPSAFANHCCRILDKTFKYGNGFTLVQYTSDAGNSWFPLDHYRKALLSQQVGVQNPHSDETTPRCQKAALMTKVPENAPAPIVLVSADKVQGQAAACKPLMRDRDEVRFSLPRGKRLREAQEGSPAGRGGGRAERRDDTETGEKVMEHGIEKAPRCSSTRSKENHLAEDTAAGSVKNRKRPIPEPSISATTLSAGSQRLKGTPVAPADMSRDLPTGALVETRLNGRTVWCPGNVVGPLPPWHNPQLVGPTSVKAGKPYLVQFHHKPFGKREVYACDLRPCTDFDWCKDLRSLPALHFGDRVLGRYRHAEGNKNWYPGCIAEVRPDGLYDIDFDDGDFEHGVRRENIQHTEKHLPQLTDVNSETRTWRQKRIARVEGKEAAAQMGRRDTGREAGDYIAALRRKGDPCLLHASSRICYRWAANEWCMGTVLEHVTEGWWKVLWDDGSTNVKRLAKINELDWFGVADRPDELHITKMLTSMAGEDGETSDDSGEVEQEGERDSGAGGKRTSQDQELVNPHTTRSKIQRFDSSSAAGALVTMCKGGTQPPDAADDNVLTSPQAAAVKSFGAPTLDEVCLNPKSAWPKSAAGVAVAARQAGPCVIGGAEMWNTAVEEQEVTARQALLTLMGSASSSRGTDNHRVVVSAGGADRQGASTPTMPAVSVGSFQRSGGALGPQDLAPVCAMLAGEGLDDKDRPLAALLTECVAAKDLLVQLSTKTITVADLLHSTKLCSAVESWCSAGEKSLRLVARCDAATRAASAARNMLPKQCSDCKANKRGKTLCSQEGHHGEDWRSVAHQGKNETDMARALTKVAKEITRLASCLDSNWKAMLETHAAQFAGTQAYPISADDEHADFPGIELAGLVSPHLAAGPPPPPPAWPPPCIPQPPCEEALATKSTMVTLDLAENAIGDKGAAALPPDFAGAQLCVVANEGPAQEGPSTLAVMPPSSSAGPHGSSTVSGAGSALIGSSVAGTTCADASLGGATDHEAAQNIDACERVPLVVDGTQYGIGVTFKKEKDGYYVVKALAEESLDCGLCVNDRILRADKHDLKHLTAQQLAQYLLGPKHSVVVIDVLADDGSRRAVSCVRRWALKR